MKHELFINKMGNNKHTFLFKLHVETRGTRYKTICQWEVVSTEIKFLMR